jgi:signal transduction histidine kinase
MTRRLVIAMTSLVALVAIALAIPIAIVVATDQRAAFVSNLETDTLATASLLSSQPFIDWQETTEAVSARTGARVVVVDTERTLIADSARSDLDRSFDRAEIDDALMGLLASDVRYSQTLATDLRYVAAPIVQNYQVVAAVRLSIPEYDVDDAIQGTLLWLITFVVAVVIAAALIAWLLARSITSPLQRLAEVAEGLPENLDLRADPNSGPAEVRKVATTLNMTAQRLSGILSRTQRVAADASHHLRTPLTGVRLRLEAIEDTASDTGVIDEAEAAIKEVDRLTHRIDQVLALARSDIGAGTPGEVDICSVLADRIESASITARERDITINLDCTDTQVIAPIGMVERIIDELLGNATAYARTHISVSTQSSAGWLILSVDDDGPGLAADELESVFQRFVRGKNSVQGGSGLGLALVSESAQALGGSASATTSALGGLRIDVTMPLASGGTR